MLKRFTKGPILLAWTPAHPHPGGFLFLLNKVLHETRMGEHSGPSSEQVVLIIQPQLGPEFRLLSKIFVK